MVVDSGVNWDADDLTDPDGDGVAKTYHVQIIKFNPATTGNYDYMSPCSNRGFCDQNSGFCSCFTKAMAARHVTIGTDTIFEEQEATNQARAGNNQTPVSAVRSLPAGHPVDFGSSSQNVRSLNGDTHTQLYSTSLSSAS